ncbi:MAG: DNA gyrase C-terminal beta-propeller domain-containing protein, partial [bacterium]
ILEGLKKALDNLDRVITIIRGSNDVKVARQKLMDEFSLSLIQAQAILDMRLHQLTGLERQKLDDEYVDLIKNISYLKDILANPRKVLDIISGEIKKLKTQYGDKRRSSIEAQSTDLDVEDLTRKEDVVITISHEGYVKRQPVTVYKAHGRGGKGIAGMSMRDEDFIEHIFITSTHSYMLVFSDLGRVYWLKVYEIPEGGRIAKGKAVINLVQLSTPKEKITAAIAVRDFEEQKDCSLMMATKKGLVKKTPLEAYSNPRRGGIIAIGIGEGDMLMSVKLTDGKQEMLLASKSGLAIRFKEENIREIGRSGKGVRGIRLGKDDEVVGMEVVGPQDSILTATENGYGKRTKIDEYRIQSRGGKGVINIKTTKRNGQVIGIRRVKEDDDLMLMTIHGQIIRQPIKNISHIGRNTQGVRLVSLNEGDKLAAIAYIVKEEQLDEEELT